MPAKSKRDRAVRPAPTESGQPAVAAPGNATNAVLALQQRAGNRAVAQALRGTSVQRDPAGSAVATVWAAPGSVTPTGQSISCHTGAEVAAVLSFLAAALRDEGAALDEDAEQALRGMAEKVDGEAARYAGMASLADSDPGYLSGYVQLAEGLARMQIDGAVSRCLSQIVVPDDDQQFQSILDDLAE